MVLIIFAFSVEKNWQKSQHIAQLLWSRQLNISIGFSVSIKKFCTQADRHSTTVSGASISLNDFKSLFRPSTQLSEPINIISTASMPNMNCLFDLNAQNPLKTFEISELSNILMKFSPKKSQSFFSIFISLIFIQKLFKFIVSFLFLTKKNLCIGTFLV